MPGKLLVVATPIGNLDDLSPRARAAFEQADLIACEDTRVSRKLTAHYGIETPLTAYHDHNAAAARPRLLARLAAGEAVASKVANGTVEGALSAGLQAARQILDAG